MSSNGFCHVSARSRTRYTELLYLISNFKGIFIGEAHQCRKRIKRSVVINELHVEFRIPFRQRTSYHTPLQWVSFFWTGKVWGSPLCFTFSLSLLEGRVSSFSCVLGLKGWEVAYSRCTAVCGTFCFDFMLYSLQLRQSAAFESGFLRFFGVDFCSFPA